jgi:Na+:H+ antiporter, NhaA family
MRTGIKHVTRRVEAAVVDAVQDFLRLESSGGILLVLAAVLAMVLKNSALADNYDALLTTPLAVRIGEFEIFKPLLLWINDGLMAIFFFLVGLELKREVLEGELSRPAQVVLPLFGAIGGMAVPALIYCYLNYHDAVALNGWAIPSATDIAFALGVLSLLGSRAPVSLKIFLTALAILDDLGAILIIALFYNEGLSIAWLALAALLVLLLAALNRFGVERLLVYLGLGALLWVAVFMSGVHATLAGVALAMTIPLRRSPGHPDDVRSPLHILEHRLTPWVAYAVLPLFGFANAGLSFAGMSFAALATPVTLGIAAGLFLGKQAGIYLAVLVPAQLGLVDRPANATWLQVYGMALLCGIGFTMSIFIGLLAFPESAELQAQLKLGVFLGSVLSGVAGALVLALAPPLAPGTAGATVGAERRERG